MAKSDLKTLIKKAEKQGWTVERTRGGHLRWIAPQGGQPYFSSSTPSDGARALKNMERDLARRGLVVASK